MKRIYSTLTLLLAIILPALAAGMTTATISLSTLQCGGCKNRIEGKITTLEGVQSVVVDIEKKEATVVFDPAVTNLATIEAAISKVGYDANDTKADPDMQKKLPTCCQPGGHK
jgi:mercuric ion binding protein